jgi:hypothetical protein
MSLPLRPEVQALVRVRPVVEWFAHSFVPGPGCGLVCSVLSSRARACRRNHQVPRVPLPDVGVTSIRETCTVSSEDITPRSSLLRTHAPIPLALLDFGFWPRSWSLRRVTTSPCCYRDSPDVISANLSPDAWSPTPTVPPSALACFFLGVIGLPKTLFRSASRWYPRTRFFRGLFLEVADISLCSGLRVCSPPRSLPPLRIFPQGSRGFYIRAYRASLPQHAPDMLSARIQAIDRKRTSTFLDLQPCRPLRVPQ